MSKTQCLLLCFSYLVVASNSSAVSFIDKCSWNDKACLKTSSQKALPHFTSGLPEIGMSPLDPINLNTFTVKEGGLNLVLNGVTVTGTRKCQVLDVERSITEKWLSFECECPIDVSGQYTAGGQVFGLNLDGVGPFSVTTEKVFLSVKVGLDYADGKDGQKHWKLGKYESSYEFKERAYLKFENLFNGDEEKAGPINTILNESWKELMETIGKPVINTLIDNVVADMNRFVEAVPASELEK